MNVSSIFDELNTCVLIPTYNNDKTLANIIDRVKVFTTNIIVVNDGSTDNTASVLDSYKDSINVLTHAKNKGKGCALRNGFKQALLLAYENVISIDSDGQHFPEDLPSMINRLKQEPGSLIIGARNMAQDDVPQASSFGNKFSNFWFLVETGIRLPDTQSGYRVYPIKRLSKMKFYCTKFEYEIEVPVRASWSGIPILSQPVQIKYEPVEDRISHFRPYTDFFRISVLNTILCLIAFAYIKPRDFILSLTWFNIKNYLKVDNISNSKLAFSIGFGFFMGIVPLWGYQMIIALAVAHLLKLHKPYVIIAANISIPPMIPIIIFASIFIGALILGKPISLLSFSDAFGLESIADNLLQYILGSLAFACIAGFGGGIISYFLLLIFRKK